jgi:hypothetical protein
MNQQSEARSTQVYGGILLASALLSVLGALHHPSGGHDGGMDALARQAALVTFVHAALLAIFTGEYVGFYGLGRRLGFGRPSVAAGFILFSLGTVAMVCAGAINGFASPSYGLANAGGTPEQAQLATAVLRYGWAMNQAFAKIGAAGWGGGMLLLSLALLAHGGLARWLGGGGIVLGLALLAGLVSGLLRMDVAGFMLLTALLAVWAIAAAALMIAGKPER